MVDPNLVHATTADYLATSRRRDRHPLHLEREMVVYKPANARLRHAWAMALRRRSGAGLILLGERLQGTTPRAHPDLLAEPASTH
jgi:hypothetical protein